MAYLIVKLQRCPDLPAPPFGEASWEMAWPTLSEPALAALLTARLTAYYGQPATLELCDAIVATLQLDPLFHVDTRGIVAAQLDAGWLVPRTLCDVRLAKVGVSNPNHVFTAMQIEHFVRVSFTAYVTRVTVRTKTPGLVEVTTNRVSPAQRSAIAAAVVGMVPCNVTCTVDDDGVP